MVFTRRVSANEKLFLAGGESLAPVIIQLVIEGEGHIPDEILQAALYRAAEILPGTRLTLIGQDWCAVSGAPPLKHTADDFDPKGGYTCDLVVQRQREKLTLCFRALHAVMDGAGLQVWTETVFKALRLENMEPFISKITEDDLTSKSPRRRNEPVIARCEGPSTPLFDPRAAAISHLTLKGVFPAITAKLAIGVQKELGGNATVMIPVNIRPYVKENLSYNTANLSLPLFVTVREGDTSTQILNQMLEQIRDRNFQRRGRFDQLYRLFPTSVLAKALYQTSKTQTEKGRYLVSSVISHVGKVTLEAFETPTFRVAKATALPCIIPVAPFSFTLSETDDATEIGFIQAASFAKDSESRLRSILDKSGLGHFIEDVRPKSNIRQESSL